MTNISVNVIANVNNTEIGMENNTMMFENKGIELMINNYNVAKENLVIRVENLANIDPANPHVVFADDLAVTYRLKAGDGRFVKVTKAVYENWKANGYDVSCLYKDAVDNTEAKDKRVIQTLPGMLGNMFGVEVGDNDNANVLVLTTESMVGGAAALFYKDTPIKLAEIFGNRKLLIIPSSIHEVLVMPYGKFDVSSINNTIKKINESYVAPEERLGNHVYLYDLSILKSLV